MKRFWNTSSPNSQHRTIWHVVIKFLSTHMKSNMGKWSNKESESFFNKEPIFNKQPPTETAGNSATKRAHARKQTCKPSMNKGPNKAHTTASKFPTRYKEWRKMKLNRLSVFNLIPHFSPYGYTPFFGFHVTTLLHSSDCGKGRLYLKIPVPFYWFSPKLSNTTMELKPPFLIFSFASIFFPIQLRLKDLST